MAIYTIVIAGVWAKTSGFVMAMFLAGLRGIDSEQLKAALAGRCSRSRPTGALLFRNRDVFLSAFVVLAMAIKSYDLVVVLTGGGSGNATEVPATFMYSHTLHFS
ncbi:MAG: hypothetical protein R3E95_10675 [Thiolinea sp.]